MKRSEALDKVASLLALDSAQHINAAIANSALDENTRKAVETNHEIAVTLYIKEKYIDKLSIHAPGSVW